MSSSSINAKPSCSEVISGMEGKLSKTEWEKCEIPVCEEEKHILQMIVNGYSNINITQNTNLSMCAYLKIENTPVNQTYLYVNYFQPRITRMITTGGGVITDASSLNALKKDFCQFSIDKKMKKIDILRLQNINKQLERDYDKIAQIAFEFVLLDLCEKAMHGGSTLSTRLQSVYSIVHLNTATILGVNTITRDFAKAIVQCYLQQIPTLSRDIVKHAVTCIEKNPLLLKYENSKLYSHQKQLFHFFREHPHKPKLVLYQTPTGTGKTLSPLGLSCQYRIIYICASRHVALAFAKNAISIQKKIAFAFGCETEEDIRLHQYAAKKFMINKRTGGIGKIDNSCGENVEIMICDLSSYLIAMNYMMEFNLLSSLVLYWDEPTISLDHESHPLHSVIHNIWKLNEIPNIVLSSATLPNELEISSVLQSFLAKFNEVDGGEYCVINSHDCRKTITILDKEQYAMLPHFYFDTYENVQLCVEHCLKNPTLLRYVDLKGIVYFLTQVEDVFESSSELQITQYFPSIESISIYSIKTYYLHILSRVTKTMWDTELLPIITRMKLERVCFWDIQEEEKDKYAKRIRSVEMITPPLPNTTIQKTISLSHCNGKSTAGEGMAGGLAKTAASSSSSSSSSKNVLLTTVDAHTLTDGVTIFFAENVDKVGEYMLQTSHIPETILNGIESKIKQNEMIESKIRELSKTIEDKLGKDLLKERKMEKQNEMGNGGNEIARMESLQAQIHDIALDARYIPNTIQHQTIWWSATNIISNAYIPNIGIDVTKRILSLNQVSLQKKLLLLLGIGVFHNENENEECGEYMEIIKELCDTQKLYLIIAQTDFIYGLNYQLCHEFFGKDVLTQMTQHKFIQACGRVGRGNIQQEYTIRIRDNTIFEKLFLPEAVNKEAIKMNELFR